ncbi:protein KRBA1 isoform X4 [Lathamus discolor]|uniref:protein KRBA1 isoform X4 n=1 Tax=Lathamus discolor TaxID=678569 RepID=UPI0032B77066
MAASRQEEGWDPPVASPQAPVTFEDVAVLFSAEEWELLEEWQRELHREVTEGTSQLLASLGPPSSPALAALVRLVKEIPEFLFGGPKAEVEPGATTSGDTEWMGVNVTMEAPSESCPLRGLERCLQELAGTGSGPSAPPASSRYGPIERHQEEPGGHQPLCVRRSPGGVTAPAVPPQSPAETQALGASSTATRRDPHRAAGTRPPATMGTATKRPLPEVGAASPVGSSTCPRGCTRASSPKKSDPGGSPAAPWQPLGEAQRPRAAVGRAHVSMAAEELGSVRRELRAMQSRQARLERGWVRGLPALTRGHRHRRRAARCLRSCCWVLDTRSRLPHGAGGASTISPLQTGLQPALAQPRLHGLLRFTDTAVLARAARTCPQPRSWAGAHLAIAPIACPHHAGPAMLPAGWPGECLPAMAKALRGCE